MYGVIKNLKIPRRGMIIPIKPFGPPSWFDCTGPSQSCTLIRDASKIPAAQSLKARQTGHQLLRKL